MINNMVNIVDVGFLVGAIYNTILIGTIHDTQIKRADNIGVLEIR